MKLFSKATAVTAVIAAMIVGPLAALGIGTLQSTAATTPTSMLQDNIYGTGIGYDTKANLWVNGNQKVAIKFKATSTTALNSVRFVQRGGSGYSLGTGGTMVVALHRDDGTGKPAATTMASKAYTPGNPAGGWEKFDSVSFTVPATTIAGSTYYILFSNTSTTNYISVNSVFNYNAVVPRQPIFADSEFGVLYTSGGAWGAVHPQYTPVVDLVYASGLHAGQSYYEAMIANYATITGATNMARERFTVTGGNKIVKSAAVRVRRSAGTSPLVLTLQNSAGTAIESVSIPAASVPISAPGGDNGGAVWVKANFVTPRTLTNGLVYHLRLSTASGTTYTTFPVRSGADKGFLAYTFNGTGQSSVNANATTPVWTDLYQWAHQDLQFYFGL